MFNEAAADVYALPVMMMYLVIDYIIYIFISKKWLYHLENKLFLKHLMHQGNKMRISKRLNKTEKSEPIRSFLKFILPDLQ